MDQLPNQTGSDALLASQQARIAQQQQEEKQKERLFEPLDLVGTEMIKSGGVGLGKYLSGKTGIKSFQALGENVSKNGLAGGLRKTASQAISEATNKGGKAAGDMLSRELEAKKGIITKTLGDVRTNVQSSAADIQSSIQDGLADAKSKAAGAVSDASQAVTDVGKAGGTLLQASGADFDSVPGKVAKAQAKAQKLYDAGRQNAQQATQKAAANGKRAVTTGEESQAVYDKMLANLQSQGPAVQATEADASGKALSAPSTEDPSNVDKFFNEDGTPNVTSIGEDLEQKAQLAEQAHLSNPITRTATSTAQDDNPFLFRPPKQSDLIPKPPPPPPAPPPVAEEGGAVTDEMLSVFKAAPSAQTAGLDASKLAHSAGFQRGSLRIPAKAPPPSTAGLVEDKLPQDDFSAPPDTKPPSAKLQAPPDTKLDTGGVPDDLVHKAPDVTATPVGSQPQKPVTQETDIPDPKPAAPDVTAQPVAPPPPPPPTISVTDYDEDEAAKSQPDPQPVAAPEADEPDVPDPVEKEGESAVTKALGTATEDSAVADENPIGDVITAGLGIASLVSGLFGGGLGEHQSQPAFPTLSQSYSAGATTAA